jgi:beta-catenin-like protein 1
MSSEAGAKRPLSSSVDDALDRIVIGGSDFIPSPEFAGSKSGYYFGTGSQGTGYYLETIDKDQPKKKPRKDVRIAEDQNETRVIVSAAELLEQAEGMASNTKVVDLSPKGVKVAAAALQKAIQTNEIQRAKFSDDPSQYMESEIALYENIAMLKSFAAEPAKLYASLLEHDVVSTLLQLLLHENSDVVTTVVSVLLEWLDSSLLVDEDEDTFVPQVAAVASLVIKDGAEYLVGNFSRLESTNGEDDQVGRGVEDVLALLENLMEMDLLMQQSAEESNNLLSSGLSVAATICKETLLVSWLFQQINDSTLMKDRALELLALLSTREDVYSVFSDWSRIRPYSSTIIEESSDIKQGSNKSSTPVAEIDGIEALLQVIALFRKKQPETDQEVESLENACLVLSLALASSEQNAQAFLERQGVELVVRCLKERVHAGGAALKLLDFNGSKTVHKLLCEQIVESGGLKYLFPIFMGHNLPQMAPVAATTKKAKRDWNSTIGEWAIRILYSLTRHLDDSSPHDSKQRLLAKFVETERCDRLVEKIILYDQKARMAEYKFFRSDDEESLDDEAVVQLGALETKLKGGGDLWHRLSAIAAFCCTGSKRCHGRILSQLQAKDLGIGLIRDALEEFISVLEKSEQTDRLESYLEHL